MRETQDPILFNPQDPFPLFAAGCYTYAAAKHHAILTDQWLDLQTKEVEIQIALLAKVRDPFPQERWIGLDPQSFLTPYVEIRTILALLDPQPGEKVIDLGCGYGRMGHVIGRHHPAVFFKGYELVTERVQEAQRSLKAFSYSLLQFEVADLVQIEPDAASFYFIYDYGSKDAIEKTLNDLKEISLKQKVTVVARGRASRFLIHSKHPWLAEVYAPQHFETFSIYHS